MSALRKAARQFRPSGETRHTAHGMAAHREGRLDEAMASYRAALAQNPRDFDALQLIGAIHLQQGEPAEAIPYFEKALTVYASSGAVWGNLATAYMNLGQTDEAARACRAGLEHDPENGSLHFNLGNALREKDDLVGAANAFESAVRFQADFAPAWGNLADVHYALHNFQSALEMADRALALDTDLVPAWNTKGVALDALDRPLEAKACYLEALARCPSSIKAHVNLCNTQRVLGELDEAALRLNAVLEVQPELPEAWAGFGNVFMSAGQPADAAGAFATARSLRPAETVYASNWMMARQYDPAATGEDLRTDAEQIAPEFGQEFPGDLARNDRPKIAFLSADLRWHPVGQFMLSVLEAWPDEAECHLISLGERQDQFTKRLKANAASHQFLPAGTPEEQVAWLRAQGFDLAVDLNGYTAGHRLDLFAARIARRQATYLGYSGTTGIPAMDAILGDTHVFANPAAFSEKPEICPTSVYSLLDMPAAPLREEKPNPDSLVFGCFANPAKMNDACLQTWATFIAPLANARLVIKNFAATSEGFRERVLEALALGGLDASRVAFLGNRSYEEHLATYNEVDFALDTFPYGGATTTAEALWMGTPVIAWPGDRYTQRMSWSVGEHTGAVLSPEEWEKGLDLFPTEIRYRYRTAAAPRGRRVAESLVRLARD